MQGYGTNRSVIDSLYGGWTPAAAVPTYSAIPEGPAVAQAGAGFTPGYGPSSASASPHLGLHAAGISTIALVVLAIIWCRLPV